MCDDRIIEGWMVTLSGRRSSVYARNGDLQALLDPGGLEIESAIPVPLAVIEHMVWLLKRGLSDD